MSDPQDLREELRKRCESDSRIDECTSRINVSKTMISGLQGEIKTHEMGIEHLEYLIRVRKRDIARDLGIVVATVNDLRCLRHPNARFNIAEAIEGSKEITGKRLCLFVCSECVLEYEEKEAPYPKRSYECADCGAVNDEIKRVARSAFGPDDYFCVVCELHLGREPGWSI